MLEGVERITGKKVKTIRLISAISMTPLPFSRKMKISKASFILPPLNQSASLVEKPLMYFENNLNSLINLWNAYRNLRPLISFFLLPAPSTAIPIIFPSPNKHRPSLAESPYGYTKQMGEQIINEFAKSSGTQCILLRYFNLVGAHSSILIGEMPIGKPQNLVPAITQTAIGKLAKMYGAWEWLWYPRWLMHPRFYTCKWYCSCPYPGNKIPWIKIKLIRFAKCLILGQGMGSQFWKRSSLLNE